MIRAEDIKYVRERTGYDMMTARAAAQLLDHAGLDIYSDEAYATMLMRNFYGKAKRFARWQEIKELVNEFGPFGG